MESHARSMYTVIRQNSKHLYCNNKKHSGNIHYQQGNLLLLKKRLPRYILFRPSFSFFKKKQHWSLDKNKQRLLFILSLAYNRMAVRKVVNLKWQIFLKPIEMWNLFSSLKTKQVIIASPYSFGHIGTSWHHSQILNL